MSQNAEIARQILIQLGGFRFLAMTGARDLVAVENGLRMSLPTSPSGFVKDGINRVTIRLSAWDLYDLEFGCVRRPRDRLNAAANVVTYQEIARAEGVYVDNLRATFTRHTGLDCTL